MGRGGGGGGGAGAVEGEEDEESEGHGEEAKDTGFWPGDMAAGIVGGAVGTAGAIAGGAIDTAGAIATAMTRRNAGGGRLWPNCFSPIGRRQTSRLPPTSGMDSPSCSCKHFPPVIQWDRERRRPRKSK